MVQKVSSILLLIGGLNWGLIGAFDTNVVAMILVNATLIKLVYILVGLAALYEIVVRVKRA